MNPDPSDSLASFLEICRSRAVETAIFSSTGEPLRSFAGLAEEAETYRQAVLERTGGKNRIIALSLPNHPVWPALVAGIWQAGSTPLLLSPEMAAAEQNRLQRLCGAMLCLTFNATGGVVWQELIGEEVVLPWPARLLKVTSGTTGQPRIIGFTLEQIAADARHVVTTMGLLPQDRNFGIIPFSHSYGFSNLITPLLLHGIPLVVADDAFPRAIADGLHLSEATVWPAVPAMLGSLVSLGYPGHPVLRLVISAGAPLPPETARLFTDLTNRSVHSFYGSSECGGICFDRIGLTGEGFVGMPLEGVQIEWHGPLEAGAGRIRVKGAAVGLGYFPSRAGEDFQQGIFSPLDLLEKTSAGWRLAGRVSDWINVGGRKVAPGIIEAALRNMPGVHAAVVFGVPEAGGRGESIVALLEGPAAEGVEMLRRRLCQELPAWQIPREWILVDQLPVNERGKINRSELIRSYLEERKATVITPPRPTL